MAGAEQEFNAGFTFDLGGPAETKQAPWEFSGASEAVCCARRQAGTAPSPRCGMATPHPLMAGSSALSALLAEPERPHTQLWRQAMHALAATG